MILYVSFPKKLDKENIIFRRLPSKKHQKGVKTTFVKPDLYDEVKND